MTAIMFMMRTKYDCNDGHSWDIIWMQSYFQGGSPLRTWHCIYIRFPSYSWLQLYLVSSIKRIAIISGPPLYIAIIKVCQINKLYNWQFELFTLRPQCLPFDNICLENSLWLLWTLKIYKCEKSFFQLFEIFNF